MILTPIPEQEQQQQQNQDLTTIDIDDNNVEALLFNYLQLQQHPTDPLPSPVVTTLLPAELLSPSLFGSPLTTNLTSSTSCANLNSTTSNSSFDPNNNVFQSPQLPYLNQLRRQSESDTGSIDFYTPPPLSASTFDLQQQGSSLAVGESWGDPFLDMLQAKVRFDDGFNQSYDNNNNNDNNTIMDVFFPSPSSSYAISAPAQPNTTDTKNIRLEIKSYTDLKNILESMRTKIGAQYSEDDIQQPRRKRRKNRKTNMTKQQEEQDRRRAVAAAAKKASINNNHLLPVAIRDTVDTAYLLPVLMEKAQTHWCCVGFKVAPVTLDMIRQWRQAPITIIYSVAAIVLVTIMDHNAGQEYVKTAAMVFYEQARRKMDDVIFDDEDDISNYYLTGNGDDDDNDGDRKKAMTIQSYFCLSYTSNLLRLYDQQRTWGGLASIALQIRTKDAETGCRPMDQAILLCYCRWYYVDAWMALTLQRECLLPETPPRFILDIIQRTTTATTSTTTTTMTTDMNNDDGSSASNTTTTTTATTTTLDLPQEHQSLYHFAILAKFMRRFIRVLRSDKLMDPVTKKPSPYYYAITNELQRWYQAVQQQQMAMESTTPTTMIDPRSLYRRNQGDGNIGSIPRDDPGAGVHLHLCYNAMRLVIIYKFLHPDILEPDDTMRMDALETNLTILQSLQQLALQGCDQSTYHYIYYAIHNTATRIYQSHTKRRNAKWQRWASQQLQINLVLLKGTQAYLNDVFQIREHAAKIEEQFKHTGIILLPYYRTTLKSMEKQQKLLQQQRTYVTNYMNDGDHDGDGDDNDDIGSGHKKHDSSMVPPAITTTTTTTMDRLQHSAKQPLQHQALGHLNLNYGQPNATLSSSTTASLSLQSSPKKPSTSTAPTASMLPGMLVYKLHTAPTIRKPRKSGNLNQTKQ